MSELMLAVLERLPSRVRRLVVAGGALLALAAVMAALAMTSPHGHRQRQPVWQAPASRPVQRMSPHRLAPPVRATAIARARWVAERFLAELTPVERRRHPRVVSLKTTATTPTFVVATALIDDGGVTSYRLRFTLEGGAGRWLVSGVQEG
jgi:hypothetical protein